MRIIRITRSATASPCMHFGIWGTVPPNDATASMNFAAPLFSRSRSSAGASALISPSETSSPSGGSPPHITAGSPHSRTSGRSRRRPCQPSMNSAKPSRKPRAPMVPNAMRNAPPSILFASSPSSIRRSPTRRTRSTGVL